MNWFERKGVAALIGAAAMICNGLAFAGNGAYEAVRVRCGEPIPVEDTGALEEHLNEGRSVAASLPNVSCIAVLFADSASGPYPFHHQSHVLRFQPAENGRYFFTAKYGLSERPGRDLYWFNQTPVTFLGASKSGKFDRNITRWEFPWTGFSLVKEHPLSVRRVYQDPEKGSHDQTLTIVGSFPIEVGGELVDRLHVVVDDWGRWRNPDDHEMGWMIYSEFANAAIRPRSTLFVKGFPGASHLRNLHSLIFLGANGDVQLSIPASALKSLNEFLYDFDVRAY